MKTISKIFLCFFCAYAPTALGQDSTVETDPEQEAQTVLDETPFLSARAAGLGGALSTLADDFDAAFYNPAGIGGLHWGKRKLLLIRKLYFPYIGATANENSQSLQKEFKEEGGSGDSAIGAAVIDANSGKRQYARASIATGMIFGRMILAPFSDYQVAAVGQSDGTQQIDTHYSSTSGLGFGFSATDNKERFSIGYFGYSASRKDTVGLLNYSDIVDKEARKTAIADKSTKYSAIGHNAGIIWRLAKKGSPALGFSLKNAGGTKYKATEGDGEDIEIEQDATVGFSVSPRLGKVGFFNFIIEAGRIEDEDITLAKKLRTGLELTFGGFGSHAVFGVRAGYNSGGASFGTSLNLGLLGLEFSQHSVDIGADNNKVIEKRVTGVFFVNVAEM